MQSVRDRFGFTEAVRIMQAEMAAALTNGQWMGWLSSNEAQKSLVEIHGGLASSDFAGSERSGYTLRRELAWTYPLHGYDPVHLAAGIVWQDGMGEPVTLASSEGCRPEGLAEYNNIKVSPISIRFS